MDFKMNDHDILIKLEQDICWIKKILRNHLKNHLLITLGACTAAMGALATLVILLVKGR